MFSKRYSTDPTGKINLRIDCMNRIESNQINVLDCFSGNCIMWNYISKNTDKEIGILRIDKSKHRKGEYLLGEANKYLKTLDLTKFDIIDLDAYGIPFKELETIIERKYSGYVIVTMIQRGFGGLPKKMLLSYGITEKMLEKVTSIFTNKAIKIMSNYLKKNNVNFIYLYSIDSRTNYFYFHIN